MATRLRMGETAQRLGLSQDTVREWVRRGFLKARRTPTGQLLFDEADVETARRGEPSVAERHSREDASTSGTKDLGPTSTWQKLPPWVTKVEAARASLTLDKIEAERRERVKQREFDEQRATATQQREAQEKAQRQRLNSIKKRVLQTIWIPPECSSDAIASIERFATPEQLPSWLAEWEQFDLVASHVRSIVKKHMEDEQERLATNRAKDQRLSAENERRSRELLGEIDHASELLDSHESSAPRSVAEALRLRRVTDP